ncbi:MAG: tRNA (adenosine(37)-N6)-threonylcarbamoyltransferase complex ATPase subunit type 1 TsaE [Patescibacteria group bacterium UBA2103]
MNWTISTLKELHDIAEEIYKTLEKDSEHATLLTLKGDLGVGKTAFTKELANILGIKEHITSPTFVLAKQYKLEDQKFDQLIHIDAYRLEEGEDLNPINFKEMLEDSHNLVVLEWPERVASALPEWQKEITITLDGEKRNITYGN